MIVKNETKVIERLLRSVAEYIDFYCICDTGSTDDTVEKITSFFANHHPHIQGKIIMEPFQNFAYNRNVALRACVDLPADYVLLLDADMVVRKTNVSKDTWLNRFLTNTGTEVQADSFSVLQGSDSFFYKNMRIVRNNGKYSYIGVTHEYVNTPPDDKNVHLPKEVFFIDDVGDGGAKSNKFERDIALLLKGIEEEPSNNVRYHFYLANSYHDCGQLDKAIEYYKKRIALNDWIEEVYYSHFRLGKCEQKKGNMDAAICHWLDAYNTIPERLESLYEIIAHYRYISKQKTAFLFYEIAKRQLDKKLPREHHLFLQNDVYTYKLHIEHSILACYNGIHNINDVAVHIFNHCTDGRAITNLLQNLKYYKDILVATGPLYVFDNKLDEGSLNGPDLIRYTSSSSCLLPIRRSKRNSVNNGCSGYWMNIRFVNYLITKNGEYLINSGSHTNETIITINRLYELDDQLKVVRYKDFPINPKEIGRRYIGVEDIRIFHAPNSLKTDTNSDTNTDLTEDNENNEYDDLMFIGTTLNENGRIGISFGKYDVSPTPSGQVAATADYIHRKEIEHPFEHVGCEKNWVFVPLQKDTNPVVVYSWCPLKLATIEPVTVNANDQNPLKYKLAFFETVSEMPRIFQHVRGSTCGFLVPETNQVWFVIHLVSYESPRHYYHMVVVMDKVKVTSSSSTSSSSTSSWSTSSWETLQLNRYSAPFKFMGEPIEYCLSLVVEKERVLMNFSVWDRTTKIGSYSRDYLESKLTYFA
jgi:tetratricopeptide (TPR) repeat protein